jgi:hypothetical protein
LFSKALLKTPQPLSQEGNSEYVCWGKTAIFIPIEKKRKRESKTKYGSTGGSI